MADNHDQSRRSRREFLQIICGAAAALPIAGAVAKAETSATLQASSGGTTETAAAAAQAAVKRPTSGKIHRVISANILLAASAHDGTPMAWTNRRALCEKVLRQRDPDLICMQEVLRQQSEDLAKDFSDYVQFGFPGPFMDANPTDYHGVVKNIVLYRKSRYDLTGAGQYWLSETPLIANSNSWDSLRARSLTWVRLRDRESGHEFRLLDTHLDHKGQTGRENQARVIIQEAGQYSAKFPQILCGDFNADRNNPAVKLLLKNGWRNTYEDVYPGKDPGFSFHGMKGVEYKPKNKKKGKIDFIFARGAVSTKATELIKDHEGTQYPSDHFFLSADLLIG